MKYFELVFLSSLSLVICWGCSAKLPPDMPKIYPCVLTVAMNGRPVAEASVSMQPTDGGRWYASGTTNAKGIAEMFTLSKYSGAVPGTYSVTVLKSMLDLDWQPGANRSQEEQGAPAISEISVHYANPRTTPLHCTVKEEDNQFSFSVEPSTK